MVIYVPAIVAWLGITLAIVVAICGEERDSW